MEHHPDRIGTHPGQPVGRSAQRIAQQRERPRSRAIHFSIRNPFKFPENALAILLGVDGFAASAMPGFKGSQREEVEPAD